MLSEAISNFDTSILHGLNALAGRSRNFDQSIEYFSDSDLKGALFVASYWWYWFRKTGTSANTRARAHLLRALGAGVVAILAARLLAQALPFRVRPVFEPALHFVVPVPGPNRLIDWSSFPSDHAAMFSALAVGLCFISWRAGLLAFLYTVFIICLPRIYLGFHYPTDIIAGLALGTLISYCVNVVPVCESFASRALRWESTSPGFFYGTLFLITFEFSSMFNSVREIAVHAAHLGLLLVQVVR